jgi:hypothetical protein
MTKEIVSDPVFLALDIETCGINKSIFAIGCVLFKRNLPYKDAISVDLITCIEDKRFAFTPKRPSFTTPENTDTDNSEIIIYNDFNIDTWDNFWSKHEDILDILANFSNCNNELELLSSFYDYWIKTTNKYHNIKLVSDNVAFDIGYIDQRIALLNEKLDDNKSIKNRRPMNYQFRKKKWYYVSPLDTNTLECVIKMADNGKAHLDTMLTECKFENNHDPISDSKRIAWIFARIMAYLTL